MFVLSHAWRCVIRNKGRNVLIIIVAAVIAASATIGLSIRQAADAARSSGLSHTSVTAQISLDRSKLFNAMRSSGNNTGTPDFKSLRASIAGKELTLADYEKYGKASSTLTGAYYTQTAAVAKTTNFQPVSSTDTSSSSPPHRHRIPRHRAHRRARQGTAPRPAECRRARWAGV
ncbi:hypothetical protein [Bifidobacterium mongoliense]|jgi:putative ABC transport system permease protein|uniref:hypothetical protein n=1 Tax=Bifidobacterium mongoliense TaxID=518643 RepID=UPI0030EF0CBE